MKSLGVLFDYNGTLVDDEHLHQKAFQEVLQAYNIDLTDELYNRACLGKTDTDCFTSLAGECDGQLSGVPTNNLLELKGDRYRKLAAGADILFPNTRQFIRRLSQDCRLAIVTGARRQEVLALLSSESLTPFFDFVVAAEDIARGKPHPEGYRKGLQRMGLSEKRVVVIEDSPSGIAAAKAAGLACIAVLHTCRKEDLREANVIVERISDITVTTIRRVISRHTRELPVTLQKYREGE